ncbi:hypothetical protein BV22DRAFT_1186836 [Leucogyrophana mollusca]|uniref:Uncharacterized protein n=1 Tax=Leucogyrophana mollusca TaxID=85980 RepID=A0ACB8AZ12_9AGAM|nr:hypothetical protein BV22DRAFT_1186836 [Leucogyrophana mollusca]
MPTMKPTTALTIAILYKDCAIINVPAEGAPEAPSEEERRKANEARLTSSRLAGLDQRLFDIPRIGLPENARPSVQALFAALKATKNINDHLALLEPKIFKKKGNAAGSHAAGIAAYNDFLKKSAPQATIRPKHRPPDWKGDLEHSQEILEVLSSGQRAPRELGILEEVDSRRGKHYGRKILSLLGWELTHFLYKLAHNIETYIITTRIPPEDTITNT